MSNSNEPSKANASYNQVVGSAKQTVGSVVDGVLGTNLQQTGSAQYNEGVAEQKAAEIQGRVEGAADQVSGTVKNVAGALTGDRAKQNEGQLQHDKGEIKSEINKS